MAEQGTMKFASPYSVVIMAEAGLIILLLLETIVMQKQEPDKLM